MAHFITVDDLVVDLIDHALDVRRHRYLSLLESLAQTLPQNNRPRICLGALEHILLLFGRLLRWRSSTARHTISHLNLNLK